MVDEPALDAVSLDAQIKCLKREIAVRKSVYPKFVSSGRMKRAQADHEIAAMTAALQTLIECQRVR